jgi:hypothetical protein
MQASVSAAKTFFKMIFFGEHNKSLLINIIMHSLDQFIHGAHEVFALILHPILFLQLHPAKKNTDSEHGGFEQYPASRNMFLFPALLKYYILHK